MRFLLGLVVIVLVALIIAVSTGFVKFGGTLGSVQVTGTAPNVTANVATVTLGSENKTVAVPTVTTTNTTVAVPTISVQKPGDAPAPAASAAPAK